MTSRTIHIAASLAIVLVAYWTYALVAVPWIEPGVKVTSDPGNTTGHPPPPPTPPASNALFAPGSWELGKDTKTISSNDQVLLLWKSYANHADGWVDLNPLTVIMLPEDNGAEPLNETERMRHATVMEVPGGANLHFDRPLDLNHGGMGRLIEGRLRGEIKIRSQGKRPDHQDDLLVLTHDVELTEQRVTTPNDVEFWYGPNTGRGRQMEMKLLPRLGSHAGNQEGPNIGGIEQFQLEHVERLHLDLGGKEDGGIASMTGNAGQASQAGKPDVRSGPVDITCRGPFAFQLVEQVATFRDRVEVLRQHPDAPSDRLNCDVLSVFFMRVPQQGAKGRSGTPGSDLQPERIEALGAPATLIAPADHFQAHGQKLQYRLVDGQVFLEDPHEVVLQKDRNEIHTPSLRYLPGPLGRTNMFQLLAAGPGWLRGEMADRPGQQLEARWNTKLEVRPQDQNEVISLTGGAALNFHAMGQLDAEEIHFWMHDASPTRSLTGPAEGQANFQPDRLLALSHVVADSPQFSSKVERLEVWFSNAANVSGTVAMQTADGTRSVPATMGAPYIPSTAVAAVPPATAAPAATVAPVNGPQYPNPAAPVARQPHMEIVGRLLQARVLMHDQPNSRQPIDQQRSELTEVTVVDGVRLRETETAQPGDQPLLVTGQRLHATEANSPQAKVTVVGQPAHLEARGMALTGPSIAIDRGANLLTMEGAGQMDKLLDRDLENRPLDHAGTIHINWRKGMNFDGVKAHFEDGVKVTSETQLLETTSLDVGFQRRVSFAEAQPQQQPQVETLHCDGSVHIVNRAFDQGQPVSYDRIWLKELDVNNLTGDIHGSGPGRVISVRHGGQDSVMPGGSLAGGGKGDSPHLPERPGGSFAQMGTVPYSTPVQQVGFGPQSPTPDPNQLTCIDLNFKKSLTGNKQQKEITFHGQVRAAYSVVTTWTATLEDDDPSRLGPNACILHSENLQIVDMSPVNGSQPAGQMPGGSRNLEFHALDNVIAEGTNFFIRCARLSYAQAKDQLIIEGDGRSDAELFRQQGQGLQADTFKGQKFIYFPKTRQVIVDGIRSFEGKVPTKPAAR